MDVLFDFQKRGNNPFAEEELPATHYYPSTQRQLTEGEKQLKLMVPHREGKSSTSSHQAETKPDPKKHLSPGERRFLNETNTMLARELPTHDTPSPRNTSSKFDESWPTSERPSTIESPSEISQASPSKHSSIYHQDQVNRPGPSSASIGGWGSDDKSTDMEYWKSSLPRKDSSPKGSILAKYIHRFRHSEPKSREERGKVTSSKPHEFWWMSPPSHSSTPTEDTTRRRINRSPLQGNRMDQSSQRSLLHGNRMGHLAQRSGVGRGGFIPSYTSQKSKSTGPSSSSPSSVLDETTAQLQAKADRLLEKSESTLLSEPAVSSEGVGFSPSTTTTDESMYVPGILNAQADQEKQVIHAQPATSTLRPEDDILYQWRVRRRLEQARQYAQTKVGTAQFLGEASIQTAHAKEPSSVDSRLEEFRQRLKQQNLLSQTRRGAAFQLGEASQSVCHTGTDPIPQSTSTQTNGLVVSSGNQPDTLYPPVAKNQPQGLLTGYDVPVRDIPAEGENTSHGGTRNAEYIPVVDDRESRYVIASPHLERTKAPVMDKAASVVPHLHLACDIIPCKLTRPHVHRDGVESKLEGSGLTQEAQPTRAVDPKQVCVQPTYRQGLQSYSGHERVRQLGEDSMQGNNYLRENTARADHDIPQQSLTTHQKETDIQRDSESAIQSHSHPRQRLDFEDVVPESPRTPPQIGTGHREEKRGGKVREGHEQVKHLSSSPVRSAIGQVISSRLFTSTPTPATHSPCSSVDTLPSMHHSPPTQSDSIAPNDGNESTSSDGEFGDDELLQILRRRRAEYEQQLQHLDQLIQNANCF